MVAAKTDSPKTAAAKSAPKPAAKSAAKSAAKPAAPAKKAAAKTPSGDRKDGIHKPVQPSKELAAIVGGAPLARGDVVSKMWDYIKKNKLQNPDDGREIIADAALETVFGKKKVTMFEMNKLISAHLS